VTVLQMIILARWEEYLQSFPQPSGDVHLL
jgi:hypothetical protein